MHICSAFDFFFHIAAHSSNECHVLDTCDLCYNFFDHVLAGLDSRARSCTKCSTRPYIIWPLCWLSDLLSCYIPSTPATLVSLCFWNLLLPPGLCTCSFLYFGCLLLHPHRGLAHSFTLFKSAQMLLRSFLTVLSCNLPILLPLLCLVFSEALISLKHYSSIYVIFPHFISSKTTSSVPQKEKPSQVVRSHLPTDLSKLQVLLIDQREEGW